MKELYPGQLWWDKNHKWSSEKVNVVFLVLSADWEGENYVYKLAKFMWINTKFSYCGAQIEELLESEIRLMKYAGNISQIKSFRFAKLFEKIKNKTRR
jgi:hypothetical protein